MYILKKLHVVGALVFCVSSTLSEVVLVAFTVTKSMVPRTAFST